MGIIAAGVVSVLYVWMFYNLPILVSGLRSLPKMTSRKRRVSITVDERLPMVSILVPVKNEERVIGRLLDALLRLDYPSAKTEIVIVEDGSGDGTVEICREYVRRCPDRITLVRRSASDGKPSALNCGLAHVRGQIVAVFDADSLPEVDVLTKVAEYFADDKVACVQGRTRLINAEENMLTRIVSCEEDVRHGVYLQGKDTLDLFVPITGTCYFIRRDALTAVDGWDSRVLSEDVDMAAKLVEQGYQTRLASDVVSWQESPSDLPGFVKQRLRWFRGCMEISLRYGRLLVSTPSMKSVDAEMTLLAPYLLPLSLASYFLSVYVLVGAIQLDAVSMIVVHGVSVLSLVSLFAIGLTLALTVRPRKPSNALWIPFVYGYWCLLILVTLFALVQMVLRRPKTWAKTGKSGVITNTTFE